MKLPPLEIRQDKEDGVPYTVDVLAPGIRASVAHQHGEPTLEGTRVPTWTIASEVLAGDSVASVAKSYKITEAQILAAVYFEAGRAWERSRARRKRMRDEVDTYWEKVKDNRKVQVAQEGKA